MRMKELIYMKSTYMVPNVSQEFSIRCHRYFVMRRKEFSYWFDHSFEKPFKQFSLICSTYFHMFFVENVRKYRKAERKKSP